jgi:hypothetical protein
MAARKAFYNTIDAIGLGFGGVNAEDLGRQMLLLMRSWEIAACGVAARILRTVSIPSDEIRPVIAATGPDALQASY